MFRGKHDFPNLIFSVQIPQDVLFVFNHYLNNFIWLLNFLFLFIFNAIKSTWHLRWKKSNDDYIFLTTALLLNLCLKVVCVDSNILGPLLLINVKHFFILAVEAHYMLCWDCALKLKLTILLTMKSK